MIDEKNRKIEEEEARIEEEKRAKEQAEFDQWKAHMLVEESGQAAVSEQDKEAFNQRFVEFIERRKVVMLEDIAAEFKILTKEVIQRIEQLEASGRLLGITDDRGKYIHIT